MHHYLQMYIPTCAITNICSSFAVSVVDEMPFSADSSRIMAGILDRPVGGACAGGTGDNNFADDNYSSEFGASDAAGCGHTTSLNE